MEQHQAADNADRAHRTARRSLLALGGLTGVGLAGLFTASPATAASGDPLKAGKVADAGTAGTGLRTKSSNSALGITQNGSGAGLAVRSVGGHGVRASSSSRTRAAVFASLDATTTDPAGAGAAVLAAGRQNVGLRATTSSTARNVPAVVSTGSGGLGIALLATGKTLLDGDVMALNSLVGVLSPAGELAYTHVESGSQPRHGKQGIATLNSGGALTIALGDGFTKAVDMKTLAVQLTAQGAAMPNLYYVPSATGFTIKGGPASGKVAWSASAVRFVLALGGAAKTTAAGSSTQATGAAEASPRVSAAAEHTAHVTTRPSVEGVAD